ncbi:MAG: ATP synthase subunit I [Thermodesulfobacteriota bacterium]
MFEFNPIEKRAAIILGLLLLVSLFFQSWPVFWGVLWGGLLGILNFHWLWWITAKVFIENKKIYGFQYPPKFFCLAAIIFFILRRGDINFLAFLIGLSALIPAILITAWPPNLLEQNRLKKL